MNETPTFISDLVLMAQGAEMQVNKVTQEAYTGNNQLALQAEKSSKNYKSNEWCTFLQARQFGYSVRKGEHGVPLTRVLTVNKKDKRGNMKEDYAIRHFTVFNFDQLEKITTSEHE